VCARNFGRGLASCIQEASEEQDKAFDMVLPVFSSDMRGNNVLKVCYNTEFDRQVCYMLGHSA